MLIETVKEALALIKGETAFPADGQIELGIGFVLRVKIPNPPINSSITPAFMEAFLELQRQIYQLAALQKRGVANATFLSEEDKRELDISVIVKEGSSLFNVELGDALKSFLDNTVGKMSGKQVSITIICLAILLSSRWAFEDYLTKEKDIKIIELTNEDHKQSLDTIKFVDSNKSESHENNQLVLEAMKQSGELGQKALEVLEKSNEALVKAATKTDETIINGVSLDKNQAKTLQASARTRAEEVKLILQVRVIDINTQDQIAVSMTIRDIENENDYKLVFPKGIISPEDREAFFKALERRNPLLVELDAKIRDDTIRSVEFQKLLKSE